MCGIAGVCGRESLVLDAAVQSMCAALHPRGPDDGGIVSAGGADFGALLGARRLAIVDPTSHGHQPFVDRQRRNVLVYNGMLYNYRELRRELEARGESFESDCDTEVVLKAYGAFGQGCLNRMEGMFAFAIWDHRAQELFLARDRTGIKPLYYYSSGERLFFASQVKTLLASGCVPFALSPEGLDMCLAFGVTQDPQTAVEDVWALPAGHSAVWSRSGLSVTKYWDAATASNDGPAQNGQGRTDLRSLLESAIRRHLVADAPIGVFLSGGLDSSAVAGLAALHTDELRTVSVSFDESTFSEAPFQELVAKHIGANHTEVRLTAAGLSDSLPAVFDAMDQPTGDAVNNFVVSRAAREAGLKVALSGLGADELFDGYGALRRVRLLHATRYVPTPLRRAGAAVAGARYAGSKRWKSQAWLSGEMPPDAAFELLRRLSSPEDVRRLLKSRTPAPAFSRIPPRGEQPLQHRIAVAELLTNLTNTVLRDTDSMSMANSLEVRVPFLDDRVVAWAFGVLARGERLTKSTIAEAVAHVVPDPVLTREKSSFEVPISVWLHGSLHDDVTAQFSSLPLALEEHVDAAELRRVWSGYLAGDEHWLRPWTFYALTRWARACEDEATRGIGAVEIQSEPLSIEHA